MKFKKLILAIGLSCVSLSIYAADQVIKEDTTPLASEGALTVDQIAPVYNQPQPQQTAPTPPGASTQQQSMPPQSMPQPIPGQSNNQNPMESPQQPIQPAPQPSDNMQGTMPQNTIPNQQPMMPSAPQNVAPAQPQQPIMQEQTVPVSPG